LISPKFFHYQNLVSIVKQASYIGIIAVGMTLVLLTGGIDLSVGSNMYLSGIMAGLLMQQYDLPAWLGLLICLTAGILFGGVNAALITRLNIIPFIATLGTMVAGRGLALWLSKSTAVSFPEGVIRVGSLRLVGVIPMPILIFTTVVLSAHVFLKRTATGRQIYAIGYSLAAAQKAGIHTTQVRSIAYILCGFFAALGGYISVAQLGIINAGFGKGDEFDAIAAAVLGGTSLFGGVGSVFPGTVLGTILIRMISAGLVFAQVNLYLQPMVAASLIFLAVFLDSIRNGQIARLRKRRIMMEK
jgi:ribose/xylose/arabinose/galactoside ABC-type transport system permease subunit